VKTRNLLRRSFRRRVPTSRRAAVSLLAFAALLVSVLVAGFGATAPKASAATCGTTNVALNKTATASSTENAGTPASAAVDGNTGTRWSSAFSDPQWLEVDLGSSQSICGVGLNWETAYGKAFQIQVSADNTNWTTIYSTTTGTGGVQNLTSLTGTGRYVRMYGTARATQYGYSLWEFQVFTSGSGGGGGGSCGTANAALNKTATASSTENAGTPASAAVDGNTGTRWSSAFSDPQWLEVDLGASHAICQVGLNWETAYGKAFQIQVSADNTNWTTIYSTTTGTGGSQNLTVSGTGRYVRMYGTARATQYGYSLWEFQVYTSS
jgi:riboflavin synthase alpha subunit